MPVPQLEQQISNWIEKSPREMGPTTHKDFVMAPGGFTLIIDMKHMTHIEPHGSVYLGPRCARRGDNRGQDIWNLACVARTKVAREITEEYESDRLIEEINEAYDEEMEEEDREFARRTKGHHRRLFSAED